MNRGEVWWLEFDPALGSEIRKTHPAVIVSNDAANLHLPRLQVIPLSNKMQRVYPSETVVTVAEQKSKAMADQIMTADKWRLKEYFGKLTQANMRAVEVVIKIHLGIDV